MQTKLKSKVIDLKWITDCIKVGKLLETEFYLVFGFVGGFINDKIKNIYIDNSSSSPEEESVGRVSKHKKNQSRNTKKPKLESEVNSKKYIKGNFLKKENCQKGKIYFLFNSKLNFL